jgi:hypothetical protein
VDTDDEKLERDGRTSGGATGPVVTDDSRKSTPKEDTARGAEASPADDELPAAEATQEHARTTRASVRALPGTSAARTRSRTRQSGGRD